MFFACFLIFVLPFSLVAAVIKPAPNVAYPDMGIMSFAPKVNPISGEYFEEACDLNVAGSQPISVNRFYRSHALLDMTYGFWRVNPETFVKANFEKTGFPLNVMVGTEDGGAVLLDKRLEAEKTYLFDPKSQKGFTNLAPGGPTAHTNPKNMKVTYWKNCESGNEAHFQFKGTIVDGSGRKLEFHTPMHKWHKEKKDGEIIYTPECWTPYQLHIDKEILPNGNRLLYTYQHHMDDRLYPTRYRLSSIEAKNRDETKSMGKITFSYPQDKKGETRAIEIVGSDGRKSDCKIELTEPQWVNGERFHLLYLSSAQNQFSPQTKYRYNNAFRLWKIQQQGGREFVTDYDQHTLKVTSQSISSGENGEQQLVARYEYHDRDTSVYDGEGNLVVYRFDDQFRLIATERYEGKELYSIEKNEWDDEGKILAHSIEDAKKKIVKKVAYTKYDERGNVLQETHSGVGLEPFVITRTYSDDGLNLKLSESDGSGKKTVYTYEKGTNLCTSESLYEGTLLKRRTLHTYDDCAICIKTVCDDGERATFRKITVVTPRYKLPCFGLPEVVEEKTIDEKGNEISLGKIVYQYTSFGKISVEDHYDASGNFCYSIENEYDERERLAKTKDPLGYITTYQYDENNNLTLVLGPNPEMEKRIDYDKANRPIKVEECDVEGHFVTTTKAYDKCGRVKSITDASGFTTKYEYDALGRVKRVIHPDGEKECKEYDILGNVTKEVDARGYQKVTSYTYLGDPLEILHPDGTVEKFTYTPHGKPLSHLDRNGSTTFYTFDIFDRPMETKVYGSKKELLKTTKAVYSSFSLKSSIDGENVTTTYSYDFAGRKISEKVAEREKKFFYDALGRLEKTQFGEMYFVEKFDFRGALTEKREEDLAGKILFQERYAYDGAGNKTHTITSKGKSVTTYNGLGLPLSKKNQRGEETTFEYSYLNGLVVRTTDPMGLKTIQKHNSRGKEVETILKNTEGKILHHVKKGYDANGNLGEEKIFVYVDGEITREVVNWWKYGPCNRVEKMVESEEKITHYFYEKGKLKKKVKPDGKTELHSEYDELGRLKHYFSSDFDYHYAYDKNDRLHEVRDAITNQITKRDYNVHGNLILETLSNGLTIASQYDNMGRRFLVTLPDDTTIEYRYLGQKLSSVKRKNAIHTYARRDLEGNCELEELPYNLGGVQKKRDELSRLTEYNSPYFTSIFPADAYDKMGNLRHYLYRDKEGNSDCRYAYDDIYQLTSENDHNYAYDSIRNRILKDTNTYTINTLNQIKHDGKNHYKYDLNGNLISDGTNTYKYDSQDRLIQFNSTTYTYDPFHRRLSTRFGDQTTTYIWDGDNEIGASVKNEITELRILGDGLGAEIGAAVLLELNNTPYVPLHDHRGNLVTLIDQHKNVHSYRYTSFGEEQTSSPLSPWRFSSKRTDASGLIYFGRRYYNPTLGRFITTDPEGFHDGPNLYAYVHNSPMNAVDLYGLLAQETMRNAYYYPGRQGQYYSSYERGVFLPSYNYHFSTGRQLLNKAVGLINGVRNFYSDSYLKAARISEMMGGYDVDGTFNTCMGRASSAVGCALGLMGVTMSPVRLLQQNWMTFFKANPTGLYLQFCHSQGAIHTRNALREMPPEIRNRIMVVAIAPAAYISRELCRSVVHYVSTHDIVPHFDFIGRFRCRSTIVTLPRHPQAKGFFDHDFLSPTYEVKIRDELRRFKEL